MADSEACRREEGQEGGGRKQACKGLEAGTSMRQMGHAAVHLSTAIGHQGLTGMGDHRDKQGPFLARTMDFIL